jgi:hypothetical protein
MLENDIQALTVAISLLTMALKPAGVTTPAPAPAPAKPAAPAKPGPKPKAAAPAEAPAPAAGITLDDVRQVSIALAKANKRDAMLDVLADFGASKLSEIPAESLDSAYQALNSLLEG